MAIMQRVRWALSQVAVPRSGTLPEPLPMILDVGDLPSGWSVIDQRRWRTGQTPAPWSVRAKQLGGVTVWRSFQSTVEGRWLWAEAIPLASESDVDVALPEVWTRTLKNMRVKVRLIDERDGPSLSGLGPSTRTLEQATVGPFGPGVVRMVAWGHRGVVSVLCASAKRETATWGELESLAATQSQRIDAVLDARDFQS